MHPLYPGAGQRPRLDGGQQLDLCPQFSSSAIGEAKSKSCARPRAYHELVGLEVGLELCCHLAARVPEGSRGDNSPGSTGALFAVELVSFCKRGNTSTVTTSSWT